MKRFLLFLSLANAAVWLGMALFFTFAVGPGVFSAPVLDLFGGTGEPTARAKAGVIAQVFLGRYFLWHHVCAALAVALLLSERFVLRAEWGRGRVALTAGIGALGLAAGLWLVPMMNTFQRDRYDVGLTAERREAAARSFRAWHGASQGMNLAMTLGLVAHLWTVGSRPCGTGRKEG